MCSNPVYHRVIVRYIHTANRLGWSDEIFLANWPDRSFYSEYDVEIPASEADNDLDTIQYESELT